MLSPESIREFRSSWLPHVTAKGLDRLIDLLENHSPLLIHGCFTRAVPMGCLATHIAWNHPATEHLTVDAGVNWMNRVAGLNPATSLVIREWDCCSIHNWEIRAELLALVKEERRARMKKGRAARGSQALAKVQADETSEVFRDFGRSGKRRTSAMIPRILEPEVMDSPDEARDYDAMDHAAVNRAFVADFLAVWDRVGPVLDVGTGTAQIPLELCRHVLNVQVTAVDMADHMLRVGRDNVRRAGLEDRIRLERADGKQLPYGTGSFGAAISNSIVHHIPEPAGVLAEMVRVVKPGGVLFVRDLVRPATGDELRRLVAAYAGQENAHQQKMFADSLHAALTLPEVRELIVGLRFDPASVRLTSDRHWTWVAKKPRTG